MDLTGGQGSYCLQRNYADVAPETLSDSDLAALERILAAADRADCQVLLLMAPYAGAWADLARLAALRDYAKEKALPLVEINSFFDSSGLDNKTDFVDPDHLNRSGAGKVAAILAPVLTEQLGLAPTETTPEEQARWEQDYITKGY